MENKKVIRHLDAPRTFGEWLHRYRFTIARRFVQFCILLAFIGTFRFGWKVLGHPLLAGDLSSSRIFDTGRSVRRTAAPGRSVLAFTGIHDRSRNHSRRLLGCKRQIVLLMGVSDELGHGLCLLVP